MITKEQNERLTQVGPGTPMGNLLRRYWHAVGVVADLEAEPVQPVRILGEDLTLFRMENGQFGLIGSRCAHRGISMAYGIPQENGLRCAYHGWVYNAEGRVVEMPFEPACMQLKLTAYPVQELAGLVFAYFGPQPAPLLPKWDFLMRDDLDRDIMVSELPCNWLQCMDNSLDPIHFEHLHGAYGGYFMKRRGKPWPLKPARHLKIAFDVFEYGIYKRRLVEGEPEDCTDWTIGHPILFPNILAQGGADQTSSQLRIPRDDTHTLHIVISGKRHGEDRPSRTVFRHEPLTYDQFGRAYVDHDGVGSNIPWQDEMAWVGQGAITDRTTEHLATSDKGILLYRKLLLENLEKVERGEDPMGVIRDPARNEPMITIARGSQYDAFGRRDIGQEWYKNALQPAGVGG
ncbi:MAG TPA: Rieske 2Fe-2S domain-containing protein [Chloroflexota bacterium]|nr:Rieske 2Fe-2S domain-containing protein [Chloroflexota bacterium]